MIERGEENVSKNMDRTAQLIMLITFFSGQIEKYADILDRLVEQLGQEGGEDIGKEGHELVEDDDIWNE